jgi:FlaG/FlaF family flagellin (archaellin)
MRRVAVGLFAAILVLFGGPAASASQPTHSRSAADVTFVDASCGFRVRVHVTGYVVFIERTDARGNVHQFDSYPKLKQTLTNIATGKSITTNIAGPGHTLQRADGTTRMVGTGIWPWGENPVTGEPGMSLTQGRWVADTATNTFTFVGHVTALCPTLAA